MWDYDAGPRHDFSGKPPDLRLDELVRRHKSGDRGDWRWRGALAAIIITLIIIIIIIIIIMVSAAGGGGGAAAADDDGGGGGGVAVTFALDVSAHVSAALAETAADGAERRPRRPEVMLGGRITAAAAAAAAAFEY